MKKLFALAFVAAGIWYLGSAIFGDGDPTPEAQAADRSESPSLEGLSEPDAEPAATADAPAEPTATQRNALARFQSAWERLNTMVDASERPEALLQARSALADVLAGPMPVAQRREWVRKLDTLNAELTFSPMQHRLSREYVNEGLLLSQVAHRNRQGVGLICAMNNLDSPDLAYEGQHLKLLVGEVRITVDRSECTLSFFVGEQLITHYLIGTGLEGSTPIGEFRIVRRIPEPPYRGVPFGDERNPLGTMWLGFADPYREYAVHGTWEPERLPGECSRGCIRMRNEEVEELAGYVVCSGGGTPITIVP